ncbi:hypothetical protein L6452_01675 [Arctium lappa]|uniref:Uncharacterized protein n=1 Tax=Arctium lappa TaxID=4217 RepID=A0ACB9FHE7_ARCLA|nr:hypothetical protein L6452_01675 [Arctium lappa]
MASNLGCVRIVLLELLYACRLHVYKKRHGRLVSKTSCCMFESNFVIGKSTKIAVKIEEMTNFSRFIQK